MIHRTSRWLALSLLLLPTAAVLSADADKDLAEQLSKLNARVYPAEGEQAKVLSQMLLKDSRARLREIVRRENAAWAKVQNRADWEKFRDQRIQALRSSLGDWPQPPADLKVRVTGRHEGDGYRIENLVFESRPGLWVTANLYQPAQAGKKMAGVLLIHSHHNPRTQGELQDMGVNWAKQGCVVLVPDMIGHGERRQHPFVDAKSYPGTFRPTRQDYYFRYNTALQLFLIGDSLMGWMVNDIQRCLDLLLARPGIDRERLLVVGSVAGGGDPAGVAAALDKRITAVAPFNFGGAQPETSYPEDIELNFDWFSHGYWETTRCLRRGAADGFAHWVIVGAAAPRHLYYCHEFSWDESKDPAWPRLRKVFGFYEAGDNLAAMHGRGSVKGMPPESTHCNNVGAIHRGLMYPTLKRWGLFEPPAKEVTERHTAEELRALTPEALKEIKPRFVHQLAGEQTDSLRNFWGNKLDKWQKLLRPTNPPLKPQVEEQKSEQSGKVTVERLVLRVEDRVVVPLMLLLPERKGAGKLPVVVGIAQQGKQELLKERSELIAGLLRRGVAVCLPDLRGIGETRPGSGRDRGSSSTSLSQEELILGQTMLGCRLFDLRSVLKYLRSRPEIDSAHVALWGDSLAPVNGRDVNVEVPLDAEKQPALAEPLGGVLALLGALFEDGVRAVYVRRGLGSYRSLLDSRFLHVPHDAIVPGVLTVEDLPSLARSLAPRQVRLEGLVDGLNRRMDEATLTRLYGEGKGGTVQKSVEESKTDDVAGWLAERVK